MTTKRDRNYYPQLLTAVFSTPQGAALLAEWVEMYCGQMFDADPVVQTGNCIRNDFVHSIEQTILYERKRAAAEAKAGADAKRKP